MMVMVTVMQMLAMMLMIWDGGGDTMATRATPPPPLFCESRWATVPAGASLFLRGSVESCMSVTSMEPPGTDMH